MITTTCGNFINTVCNSGHDMHENKLADYKINGWTLYTPFVMEQALAAGFSANEWITKPQVAEKIQMAMNYPKINLDSEMEQYYFKNTWKVWWSAMVAQLQRYFLRDGFINTQSGLPAGSMEKGIFQAMMEEGAREFSAQHRSNYQLHDVCNSFIIDWGCGFYKELPSSKKRSFQPQEGKEGLQETFTRKRFEWIVFHHNPLTNLITLDYKTINEKL